MSEERGQVVLVAAAVVVVALVAMLLAAVQLGYQPTPTEGDAAGLGQVERHLEAAVRRAANDLGGQFSWRERGAAAAVVRANVRPAVSTAERSGVADDVTYRIERNESAASAVVREFCPRGEDQVYGDCVAHGAVVLQERAGETHLLGVVLDVRVVGTDRTTRATLFVRPFE